MPADGTLVGAVAGDLSASFIFRFSRHFALFPLHGIVV
jgi:hypothetical protein